MKFQLKANKQDTKLLSTKYNITNLILVKYIDLNSFDDITKIQELLNKQIYVDFINYIITVLN